MTRAYLLRRARELLARATPEGECLVLPIYKGARYPQAALSENGEVMCRLAHTFVYETLVGPRVFTDLHHTCRNRACINVEHLQDLTHLQHAAEHPEWGTWRDTHCRNGHEYVEGSYTMQTKNGYTTRRCKLCRRERRKRGLKA